MSDVPSAIPQTPKRLRHEYEFLPAALEIIETPPSPAGRWLMMTVMAFIAIATLWACIGKLDIIATAEGRIIPTGKVKIVQPFETGVVKSIAVRDGEHVHAGDALIELDPTIDQAEMGHVQHDLLAAQIDAARLKALQDGTAELDAPDGADPVDVTTARSLLTAQRAEQAAKLDGLNRQIEEKQAEADGARATIEKGQAALPTLQKRMSIRKYLSDNEYGSKLTYLEAQQAYTDQAHDIDVARHRVDESTASIASLKQQQDQAAAEFLHTNLDKLSEDEAKIGSLSQDLDKARQRTMLQTLRAPVDGTVQQLAIHTVGGVVTPAQQLLTVVPDDAKLEIEASLPNRDVGFVHAGQNAEVKVEAFTFTRYGLLHGKVIDLSRDSAPVDDRQSQGANGGNPRDSFDNPDEARQSKQAGYVVRVSLDRTSIDTETGSETLGPGMAVTVEIRTGRRRVIDYLLSPLKRYRHEGLTER